MEGPSLDKNLFKEVHLNKIIDAIMQRTAGEDPNRTFRILDMATGKNTVDPDLLPNLVIELSKEDIDYELILTDQDKNQLMEGYNNISKRLNYMMMTRISPIMVDNRKMKGLFNPLSKTFADDSFDLVLGRNPYSNMQRYTDAMRETARVLKRGGHKIFLESQGYLLNDYENRTRRAWRGANTRHVDDIARELKNHLSFVEMFSSLDLYQADYKDPDEIFQNGDVIESAVLVYKKD